MEDHLKSFLCPITHDVMENPVVACDGHSYERSSILRWFRDNNTSPITNTIVVHKHVVPNHALKQAINEYQERFASFMISKPIRIVRQLKPLEILPERGLFVYSVLQEIRLYNAPHFVAGQSIKIPADTIVIGKERLYGEDNVVFVELSGRHEGDYIYEARDGVTYLKRLELVSDMALYSALTTVPFTPWPSRSMTSNSLYKAYTLDVISIEYTIRDPQGRLYGRLEQSKLWVYLSDMWLTPIELLASRQLFYVQEMTDIFTNANKSIIGAPIAKIPRSTIIESEAFVRYCSNTWYIRTSYNSHVGWIHLHDTKPMTNPPSRIAEGPAGKLVQLVMQGGSIALILDEVQEDGEVSQRMLMRQLPRRFERQLHNCVQKGRRVHRIALGPHGEWYCSGAKPDGTGECCWASDTLPLQFHRSMEPNSLVAFGEDDEYAMILGSGGICSNNLSSSLLYRLDNARRVHMIQLTRFGGFVVKDNRGISYSCLDPVFETALSDSPRGAGQVCSAVYSDDEYLVLFEHTFVASSGISSNIIDTLTNFYERHRQLRHKRRLLINEYHRLQQNTDFLF